MGHYINADDLLRDLEGDGIAFDTFGIEATWEQVRESLISTRRLAADHSFLESARVQTSRLTAPVNTCDAYVAASIADFLHEQLLARGVSFSFETVMSHPSKVQIFGRARANEYRTYLYFIATGSPNVNRGRVEERVSKGGHDVPEQKVLERYERSLRLVREAIVQAYRAYIFDNSGAEPILLAEYNPQGECLLKLAEELLPKWFHKWVKPTT